MKMTSQEEILQTRRVYEEMQGGNTEHNNRYWRAVLWKKYLYIVHIVTFTELVILFLDDWAGLFFLPWPIYLLRFLILPATINYLSLFFTYGFIHSPNYSEEAKNNAICYLLSVITGVTVITHYVFGPVLSACVFAIVISSMMGSKKTTRNVFHMSYFFLAISVLEGAFELRKGDNQLFIDAIIAAILYLCAYIFSNMIWQKTRDDAKILQDSIRHQIYRLEKASRDVETDLYNKSIFLEDLQLAVQSEDEQTSMAIFNLDNFKNVNDTYGHAMGDRVISTFASILNSVTTEGTRAYRYDGDEFAMIFRNKTFEEINTILENIRIELKETSFTKKDAIFHVTVSIGMKTYNSQMVTKEELIKGAKDLLTESKKGGKNRLTTG